MGLGLAVRKLVVRAYWSGGWLRRELGVCADWVANNEPHLKEVSRIRSWVTVLSQNRNCYNKYQSL